MFNQRSCLEVLILYLPMTMGKPSLPEPAAFQVICVQVYMNQYLLRIYGTWQEISINPTEVIKVQPKILSVGVFLSTWLETLGAALLWTDVVLSGGGAANGSFELSFMSGTTWRKNPGGSLSKTCWFCFQNLSCTSIIKHPLTPCHSLSFIPLFYLGDPKAARLDLKDHPGFEQI